MKKKSCVGKYLRLLYIRKMKKKPKKKNRAARAKKGQKNAFWKKRRFFPKKIFATWKKKTFHAFSEAYH